MVVINIDTTKDSKEELQKTIQYLQALVGGPVVDTVETPAEQVGVMDMFGAAPTEEATPMNIFAEETTEEVDDQPETAEMEVEDNDDAVIEIVEYD